MANVKFIFSQSAPAAGQRQEGNELGAKGEQMATRYLVDKGFVVLDRNYRDNHKEVDLIALDGDELVFVEVKTRSTDYYMQPEEAVDRRKRQHLVRVANRYVHAHNRTERVRFDVVAIVTNDKETRINHIKDAFNVMNY